MTELFKAIEIETITACNRRCSYCPNSKYKRGLMDNLRKMPLTTFRLIVDQLSDINFSGRFSPHFYNEPLLDERLPDLLGHVSKKLPSVRIKIYSNGDLLTLEMYKRLVEVGVSEFDITQHSKRKLPHILEVVRHNKAHDDGVKLEYNKLKIFFNRGGIIRLRESFDRKTCRFMAWDVTVDYRGNVILCCNDYFSSVKFGNVRQTSIGDIWNNQAYKDARRELAKGKMRFAICQKCQRGIY